MKKNNIASVLLIWSVSQIANVNVQMCVSRSVGIQRKVQQYDAQKRLIPYNIVVFNVSRVFSYSDEQIVEKLLAVDLFRSCWLKCQWAFKVCRFYLASVTQWRGSDVCFFIRTAWSFGCCCYYLLSLIARIDTWAQSCVLVYRIENTPTHFQ